MTLPSAPTCTIHVAPLYAGERGRVEVELVAEHDTRISYIDVEVLVREGWTIRDSTGFARHVVQTPIAKVRVMGPGVLAAGTTRFVADVDVPLFTPPSHDLAPAHASLPVRVHVSIPWWPDGRYRFVASARVRSPAIVERAPVVASSAASGARIELALASSRLVAGEMLVGACAVYHLDDREPREVRIGFVPRFTLRARSRTIVRDGDLFTTAIMLPAKSGGTKVSFQIPIPAEITPSFDATTHALSWDLIARTGKLGGWVELYVPIHIVDAGALATTARLTAVPSLAEERVAVAFARFAADHDWRVDTDEHTSATSIARDGPGHVELHLAYAYRETGTFVVARLSTPSLGLGLHVTPSSTLRHLFFRDIEVDIAAWDREHLVRARSPEQAIPVLRTVAVAMIGERALGDLVRWTDDELVFERAVAQVTAGDLARIAIALDRLAPALVQALAAVGPPPSLGVDVAAWQELARWLHGALCVGDLSITGSLAQAPVQLGLRFDEHDRPTAVRASVGEPFTATDAHAVTLTLARPALAALRAPPEITELLVAWPASFVDLSVADGVASASWLIGDDLATDTGRVRELVESLRAIVATLARTTGPYR